MDTKVAVVGMGSFGQAVASLLDHNNVPFATVERTNKLNRAVDVAFVAVPTQSIRQAIKQNQQFLAKQTLIVNCAKGMEEETHLLPYQIIQETGEYPHYCSLSGPSFAEEITKGDPAAVSVGAAVSDDAWRAKSLLETPYFHVSLIEDYRSLELVGALKNIYAILCGYAEGIGFRANTQARLITCARQELKGLAEAMGYAADDIDCPGGIGDLILTCTSRQSRNYSYGLGLAKTRDTDPHESPSKTVEGYHTVKSVRYLKSHYNTHLPLANLAASIVSGENLNRDRFIKQLDNTSP